MTNTFYEFFAGGGMARLGLGTKWNCLLANDIDPKKVATYVANFGDNEVVCKDVFKLTSHEMLGSPTLAWASFPCQDLSLAGNRSGLAGERSGAFWGFWEAINRLRAESRAPKILVLENVAGTLTSNKGNDFVAICSALVSLGYSFGAVIIDAVDFIPQSRPRLFIVCTTVKSAFLNDVTVPRADPQWHSPTVCEAVERLPAHVLESWRWWKLPSPNLSPKQLVEMIEPDSDVKKWHSEDETCRLLSMMSPANLAKVEIAKSSKERVVGTIYKRMRLENGIRVQRAEARFDGVAGCLRTPMGGSSRQIVVVVDGQKVKSRLLTVREAARLMGVPDTYKIPSNYNEGYHVFGDGVAVPAVRFLNIHLIEKIAEFSARFRLEAA